MLWLMLARNRGHLGKRACGWSPALECPQHGDGLGLILHGGSTPAAVPHNPASLASRAPSVAQGRGAAQPDGATWSRGWKHCQVSAPASAPLRGTPGPRDKNSLAGAEPCRAGLQPGVVHPAPL